MKIVKPLIAAAAALSLSLAALPALAQNEIQI
jgi:hypothetical protein